MLTSLAPSNSSPSGLLNVNGTLLFEANDGTHGLQLWKSDGTVAGTLMITNFSHGLPTNLQFGLFSPIVIGPMFFLKHRTPMAISSSGSQIARLPAQPNLPMTPLYVG
jgi:ELWxxDGT repeat protein